MSAAAGRKARGDGHERRAEILDAAQRLFVEHGYEGATIRKIADAVGLSSTALYMHFREKDEILAEICRASFARLIDANDAIRHTTERPETRLVLMLRAYLDFAFANPDAYRLVYLTRPAEARGGAEATATALGHQLYRSFETEVEAVAAAGRLAEDPRVAAQVLWAGVHGLASLIITKPYFDWVERDRLVDALLASLERGLIRS